MTLAMVINQVAREEHTSVQAVELAAFIACPVLHALQADMNDTLAGRVREEIRQRIKKAQSAAN